MVYPDVDTVSRPKMIAGFNPTVPFEASSFCNDDTHRRDENDNENNDDEHYEDDGEELSLEIENELLEELETKGNLSNAELNDKCWSSHQSAVQQLISCDRFSIPFVLCCHKQSNDMHALLQRNQNRFFLFSLF
jgi:hypothetical protein